MPCPHLRLRRLQVAVGGDDMHSDGGDTLVKGPERGAQAASVGGSPQDQPTKTMAFSRYNTGLLDCNGLHGSRHVGADLCRSRDAVHLQFGLSRDYRQLSVVLSRRAPLPAGPFHTGCKINLRMLHARSICACAIQDSFVHAPCHLAAGPFVLRCYLPVVCVAKIVR